MNTPDITIGTLPAEAPPDVADADTPETPAPEAEEPASRRKKWLLLLLLLGLVLLVLFSLWYLLFRKPVTEIPLPVPPSMPAYQGSLYDLSRPQSVAVSADGSRIYITQTGTSLDTVMMDRSGATLAVLQPPADWIPQAHQLFVAVDPVTGEVWATDRFNGAVAIYSASGSFLRLFDPGAERAGWQPLGIGFDKTGDVYVADVADSAATVIDVFGADGTFLRSFGAGQSLDHPNGIAVAPDSTVYVTDTGNGRLLVFDPSGDRVGTVSRGVAPGNLGLPVGVVFDDHGRIAVVDSTAATVQLYAPIEAGASGPAYIDRFGEQGNADAQLSFPNGLAADGRGRLYVADWGNDRLEIWSY